MREPIRDSEEERKTMRGRRREERWKGGGREEEIISLTGAFQIEAHPSKETRKGLKMLCLLPHSPRELREGGGQAGSIKQSSRKKSPPPPLPSQESQAEVTSASSGRDTKKE